MNIGTTMSGLTDELFQWTSDNVVYIIAIPIILFGLLRLFNYWWRSNKTLAGILFRRWNPPIEGVSTIDPHRSQKEAAASNLANVRERRYQKRLKSFLSRQSDGELLSLVIN
jgi:hypothetical protein